MSPQTLDSARHPHDHRLTSRCSLRDKASRHPPACCSIRPSTAASTRSWRSRMLFGFAATQQVRVPSVSTSRFNLKNAAFLDRRRALLRGRPRRRFRPQQDSAARSACHSAGKADRRRAADGVGGARESRRRRQPGVSARHREIERHRRSGCADAQRADRHRPIRTAPSSSPGLPANLLSLLALPGRQGLGRQKSARAEHCRRAVRRKRAPIRSFERMSPASGSCWPSGRRAS